MSTLTRLGGRRDLLMDDSRDQLSDFEPGMMSVAHERQKHRTYVVSKTNLLRCQQRTYSIDTPILQDYVQRRIFLGEVPMADEVGVAILGSGVAGRVHAPAASALGASLGGEFGADGACCDAAAIELGAEPGFAQAVNLIGHPVVEVVHFCTPKFATCFFCRTA